MEMEMVIWSYGEGVGDRDRDRERERERAPPMQQLPTVGNAGCEYDCVGKMMLLLSYR